MCQVAGSNPDGRRPTTLPRPKTMPDPGFNRHDFGFIRHDFLKNMPVELKISHVF
jgi:hypothetical protein